MKELTTAIIIIILFWGSAYIIGSQIRRGLEKRGNYYNVDYANFTMAEAQVEKVCREILKEKESEGAE